ncbi:D-2-hydroxyacid dehydrogenase [Alteromonas australica]|uniref:D-2-hydroxyacid dehydrogenase n=1 Tax=Alteromonas australica TaxID=589873 RepID=UPI0035C7FC53
MSKWRSVFLDAETLGLDSLDTHALDQLNLSLTCYQQTSEANLLARIADADIILVNKVQLEGASLCHAPHLKYIGVTATGTNNIDLEYCKKNGIRVQNVEGYGTDSVAQHTLMLLLNLATNFSQYQRDIKAGRWSKSPHFCLSQYDVMELAGKHAVIVGHGELGKRVEGLFKALGMQVSIAARPGNPNDTRPSLNTLLPKADVVSLHCPLTRDTEKLINCDTLSLMKPTCFLINTARGGLIDEAALLQALKAQTIGGAALDVLTVEPPPENHPLMQASLPNLLITPHNAWIANASRQRLLNKVVEHLAAFIA